MCMCVYTYIYIYIYAPVAVAADVEREAAPLDGDHVLGLGGTRRHLWMHLCRNLQHTKVTI